MYLILYLILLVWIVFYWFQKKNYLYSTYFLLISLYSIPTLYGSYYYPELLYLFGASIKPEIIDSSLIFSSISSLLIHFFLRLKFSSVKFTKYNLKVKNGKYFAYLLLFILFTTILLLEFHFGSEISYLNISKNINSLGFPMKLLSFLVKSSWVILLYIGLFSFNSEKKNNTLITIFVFGLVILSYFSFNAGNRSDFVIFFLGILVYLVLKYGLKKILSFYFLTLIIVFFLFMNYIEIDRQNIDSPLESTFIETILLKDYFAPYLILTAAIDISFISPLYVLKSNFYNLFGFYDFPLLQEDLGNVMRPGSSSRTEGFGFFPFAEGYIFFGFFGVFYNFFVLGSILKIYNWISLRYNYFVFIPILTSQLIYMVRSQSIYSIRFLIFQFTFILFLNFLLDDDVNFNDCNSGKNL